MEDPKQCIRDLIALAALPATWAGGGPEQILERLADALTAMLDLDFARVTPERFDGDAMLSMPLGLDGAMGWITVGSRRADFPTQTERLLLNIAANHAALGLQEARWRRTLAGAIAHEITQPLTAMLSNADAGLRWLASEPRDVARVRESLENVVADGREAAEMVQRMRASVSCAAVGGKTRIALNEVIAHAAALPGIVVQMALDVALPPVNGDRIALQQLISNLVKNSAEAGAKTITISTRRADGDCVQVEVADDGPGVEDAEKVFEAFYTTKASGLGMGLTICRSVANAHGGYLWLARDVGPGATFCFRMPTG